MMVNQSSEISVAGGPIGLARDVFGTLKRAYRLTFVGLLVTLAPFAATSMADDQQSKPLTVMALGDSLTAGYGLPTGDGFVPQLEAWLAENAPSPVRVVNAGVSGDTTSGGRSRLAWSLGGAGGKPDLVLLELGANDGLRGIDPARTRENLDAIIADLKARDIPVLIAGMMAPPNLGPDYAADFNPIFPDLATKHGAALYPFFLDGVAADPALNQDDGIHPTKEGVAIIVEKLGPVVLAALTAKTIPD